MFLFILEKKEGRGSEKETSMREALIGYFPHTLYWGSSPKPGYVP